MTLPFVISIPHCSGLVPPDIRPALALTEAEIMTSVDIGSEEIFGGLSARGVLRAGWSRLVVDLNRDPLRADDGGLIPKLDYQGRPVYREGMYPDGSALRERIARYFLPFHRSIAELLDLPGVMGLLDCHSMDRVGPRRAPDAGKGRKDIVLGNNGDERGDEVGERGPLTCPRGQLEAAKAAFEEQGFSVSLNDPYAGGFITAAYGRRLIREGKVAIQVELNQALYVDFPGRSLLPRSVEAVRDRVSRALGELAVFMG